MNGMRGISQVIVRVHSVSFFTSFFVLIHGLVHAYTFSNTLLCTSKTTTPSHYANDRTPYRRILDILRTP